MTEIVFVVEIAPEGGYTARALGVSIFTEADTEAELRVAVSFGKKLEAKTIITGGQSRFANSKHFTDQAQKYIDGNFKTIYFYKEDVLAHEVTSYKPGFSK